MCETEMHRPGLAAAHQSRPGGAAGTDALRSHWGFAALSKVVPIVILPEVPDGTVGTYNLVDVPGKEITRQTENFRRERAGLSPQGHRKAPTAAGEPGALA